MHISPMMAAVRVHTQADRRMGWPAPHVHKEKLERVMPGQEGPGVI